ncbi:MAG: FecCD family ABC transporter permease [Phycisphaerales bacterium JB037]
MSKRGWIVILALLGVLVAGGAVRLLIGSGGLAWASDEAIREIRIDRVIVAIVVGGSLGAAGVMLQSLLRNPLASPDLVGVTAGASLAVVLALFFAAGSDSGGGGGMAPAWSAVPAVIGAVATLALVYALGQRGGLIEPATLILVGVMIAIICGAGIQLVVSLMPAQASGSARWLFGSITDTVPGWAKWGGAGVLAVCLGAVAWAGPWMDASALGDDEAQSVGVRLGWLRAGLFVAAGVLTAASVVIAGPIGFVGLVCPHLVRLLAGPSHRALVIGAAIAGAGLVVWSDVLVRAVEVRTGRLPLGVVTSLVGGPVFLVLLRREIKR